jgi:uncharacterized protein YndB with AHSA1/START domain
MTRAKGLQLTQEIKVSTNAEAVWNALIKPECVREYHLAPLLKIELWVRGEIVYGTPEKILISGEIIECEQNARLMHTFRFGSQRFSGTGGDTDTVVKYEISEEGSSSTIVKVTHTGFIEENQTYCNVVGGWPYILERLKVWLEKRE